MIINNMDDVVNDFNKYFVRVLESKLAGKILDSVTAEEKNGDFIKNKPNSYFLWQWKRVKLQRLFINVKTKLL